jgi:peptidoglycan/xylan/chitin deacetylase (PgdA/CDA1 family)
MTPERRFILTVDDPGGLIQDLPTFDRTRRFFDDEGVPATFFVVPRGDGGWVLDKQTDWLEALRGAESAGHNCQLHGLDHKDCEFGPYPEMIRALDLVRGPEEHLRQDTEAYGYRWNPDIYAEKLALAIDIFGRAFERRPQVFRTGALSQGPGLYDVVADARMRYVSNSITDPRGWKYIIEEYDNPGDWDPNVPPGPYQLTDRIVNLPIMGEYAWYLTEEKIERHLALAIDDLQRAFDDGGIFLFVCHVQCVGAEDGLSQKLLHRLFKIAREDFGVTFGTVEGLVADIEAGEVKVREAV